MEVDLKGRNKSTSTEKAVLFLTFAFIAGCFIGVGVYSNMTSGRGQREYKVWVASVENSQKARAKYYKSIECYLEEVTSLTDYFTSLGKKSLELYKLDLNRLELEKVRVEGWLANGEKRIKELNSRITNEEKAEKDLCYSRFLEQNKKNLKKAEKELCSIEASLSKIKLADSKLISVNKAKRELERAEEKECIALNNLKVINGLVGLKVR